MYSLKNINQIRQRLSLLEYISWKSVALLSVILEARIELIYLQICLWISSASAQKKLSISLRLSTIIAFAPFSIPYLTIAGWLLLNIFLRVTVFIFEEAKSSIECGTHLLGSLSITLYILENHRYLLCFCVLMLILLNKNCFLNVVMS